MNTLLTWPNGRSASTGTLLSIVFGNVVCIAIWLHLWLIPDFPMPGQPIAVLVMTHLAGIALSARALPAARTRQSAPQKREMTIRRGNFQHMVAPAPAAGIGIVVERVWNSDGNGGHRPWFGNAKKGNPAAKKAEDRAEAFLSEYLAD